MLIFSVPHLSHIHGAPSDYYRYTRYGIGALCDSAGLEILSIEATCGLVAFLAHYASIVLMGTVGLLPVLRWPIWLLNYIAFVLLPGVLDRLVGLPAVFPRDYVVLARKAAGTSSPSAGGPTSE
jgi:hypothetical protein